MPGSTLRYPAAPSRAVPGSPHAMPSSLPHDALRCRGMPGTHPCTPRSHSAPSSKEEEGGWLSQS